MKYRITLGLCALLLVGCSDPSPQQSAEVAAPASEEKNPATVANPDFPEGIAPEFAYKIRSRSAEETPAGRLRKLVIEFKEGDVKIIDSQIDEALVARGYRRYKTVDQGESMIGDYGKSGHRITVTTSPKSGKLRLEANSLGTVYFVWKE